MGFRIGNEFIGNDKVFYKSESSMTKLKIGPKNGGWTPWKIFTTGFGWARDDPRLNLTIPKHDK